MENQILELKKIVKGISILYVEDNPVLMGHIKELLSRFFHEKIYFASDGEEGYALYRKHSPQIVLADIKLPKLNGMAMAHKIIKQNPFVKIIYLSGYNDVDLLHKAIKFGLFDYLTKPVKAGDLIETLHRAIVSIKHEENQRIFLNQLQDIFNYQSNLVVMYEDDKPVLVNSQFLDFFSFDSFDDYLEIHRDLNSLFVEHDSFLFSTKEKDWYSIATLDMDKFYHTKMFDQFHVPKHFLLKLKRIPDKENAVVISLNDITDLNLMQLFDRKRNFLDNEKQAKNSIVNLFKLAKDHVAPIEVYNHYKGVPIVKNVVISEIEEDGTCTIKTEFTQLKIVSLKQSFILVSDVFPANIMCKNIKKIDFDKQSITFSGYAFETGDITERKNMRIEPGVNDSVSIFHNDTKIPVELSIIDLSIISVKLKIGSLPSYMCLNLILKISFVLHIDRKIVSLTTQGRIYALSEGINGYELVFVFVLTTSDENKMLDYVAHQQLVWIREFKEILI